MENNSKQQEALNDAEATPIAPPTYEDAASVSSADDYYRAGTPIVPVNEEPSEVKAEFVPEIAPQLPKRPTTASMSDLPLKYTFSWRRPILDYPTLTVYPTSEQAIPSTVAGLPSTSHWRLNYQAKYFSRLHRYTGEHDKGDFPFRQVAEIKFPEFVWPGCGPTIKFEPHEEEVARLGSRHVSRTDKFMHCTGWFSTKYALDLPILNHRRVVWKSVKAKTSSEPDIEANVPASKKAPIAATETKLVTVGDIIEQAKKTMNDETWTPYPKQQLVEETSGHVLATYSRAAPWAQQAGVLEVVAPEGAMTTPEYIEGILIACVAMVGMQDRLGLASSLLEAGTESFSTRKGKKKACICDSSVGEPSRGVATSAEVLQSQDGFHNEKRPTQQ